MSSSVVLDSSAILALANGESGADVVRGIIFHSVVSTVNLAEVFSIFSLLGTDARSALGEILFAVESIVPFSVAQAKMAGDLRVTTKHLGLSLGDRACLALALELGADVYTSDRAWKKLDIGCNITLLR